MAKRKIIVYIATSADGFIARRDGDMEWLTGRPAPKGFYGMSKFMASVDTRVLGRKTYETSLRLGATFGAGTRYFVFSRRPSPKRIPPGVEFVKGSVAAFARRMRAEKGKDIWLMGGGGIIAAFLGEGAIDEFIISIIPTIIGEGIPLIAPRHLQVPLRLLTVQRFADGVVQLHYRVRQTRR